MHVKKSKIKITIKCIFVKIEKGGLKIPVIATEMKHCLKQKNQSPL